MAGNYKRFETVMVKVLACCESCGQRFGWDEKFTVQGSGSTPSDATLAAKRAAAAKLEKIRTKVGAGEYVVAPEPCPSCKHMPQWMEAAQTGDKRRLKGIKITFFSITAIILTFGIYVSIEGAEFDGGIFLIMLLYSVFGGVIGTTIIDALILKKLFPYKVSNFVDQGNDRKKPKIIPYLEDSPPHIEDSSSIQMLRIKHRND